ncbi:1-acyl-sn-glycerol-3-phosphate acyltransferase [Myxococcota bacterium]
MQPKDKERIKVEVCHRVLDHYGTAPSELEHAIFDTVYHERQRLEKGRKRKAVRKQAAAYDRIYREAQHAGPERHRELLREIIHDFVEEVTGHFDPRVYSVATKALPPTLTVLLNTLSPLRLMEAIPAGFTTLDEQLEVKGEAEGLKKAAQLGTTVLVPTHSSNLDSLIIGFSLFRLGLPPYTYGAGLNLFSNKLISFFMHNLGAYKVDRRKKAAVYKDVLKAYAGCSIEMGYHNLFFPGGTRSRSGAVEQKLKLGLLGMGLDAYVHNLQAGKAKPDVFIVPCTLNYQLVLEAETLIDDHLKEVGKSRYIIEDDEFSEIHRVLQFVQKLFSLNSHIQIVVSKPLDPFGNEVDLDGVSRDNCGRPLDRSRYVHVNGEVGFDRQRDAEYTRELARSVVGAYVRDTMLNSTNLLSHVVFGILRQRNSDLDLYRLLRTGGQEESLALTEVYDRLDRELAVLRRAAEAGQIRLDDTLSKRDTVSIVGEALAHLASYHSRPALVRRGDRLFHEDCNLLLYYQNRLDKLGLPDVERVS